MKDMNKLLTPYIEYKCWDKYNEIRRYFLIDKNSFFVIRESNYTIVDQNSFYISYQISRDTYNSKLADTSHMYNNYTIEAAKIILDRILVKNEFVLLDEDDYEKYSVLI